MFTEYIFKFINYITNKDENMMVFISHGGCQKDKYNINNYKSDNSLSFFNYIIKNYGNKYKYRIAVDYNDFEKQKKIIRDSYPSDIDIDCFPYFNITGNKLNVLKIKYINLIKIFSKTKYIFSSENSLPFTKTKEQIYTILGYYIPFKNDYNLKYVKHSNNRNKYICDYYITTSLLSSQIISHTYDIPLYKFKVLGFSRNDNLLDNSKNDELVRQIKSRVDYKVNKIILYTPTHRDYERIDETKESRQLLGFNFDKNKLETYLSNNGIIIICKVHSAQNTSAIIKRLPKGVVIFEANDSLGLCELMQNSDALITDYTSAYFDYLLLDKPVIFNFYDFDKYNEFRGFSFDPIDSILAGDIVTNEDNFYNALNNVINNKDTYKRKRNFVRNLVHKYIDQNSSERIYNFLIKKD